MSIYTIYCIAICFLEESTKKEKKEGVELCSLKEPKFSLFYILVLLRKKRNLNHCAVHLSTSCTSKHKYVLVVSTCTILYYDNIVNQIYINF